MTNLLEDSLGDVNHKLDYRVGSREHGQLVQIDRANQPIPVQVVGVWPTYSASFSFAAISGDAVVIFGQTGKAIHVQEIGIAKPSAVETVQIIRRITVDSGGTSTIATNVAPDAGDGPSPTIVRVYTAAPTAGTSAGTITRGVVDPPDILIFDFRNWPKQPTLRKSTDCLAINVDATATLPGWIIWTEEPL